MKIFRKIVDYLVEGIKKDTMFDSTLGEMLMHRNYKIISKFGDKGIKCLLERLFTVRNSGWIEISLISTMVNNSPHIPEELAGRLDDIVDIYLEWGRNNGYI